MGLELSAGAPRQAVLLAAGSPAVQLAAGRNYELTVAHKAATGGVGQLTLTPRGVGGSPAVEYLMFGTGDVLVVSGDEYNSLSWALPPGPPPPTSALETWTVTGSPVLSVRVTAVQRGWIARAPRHTYSVLLSAAPPAGAQSQTDTWVVPVGVRWRIHHVNIVLRAGTTTGSRELNLVVLWGFQGSSTSGTTPIADTGPQTGVSAGYYAYAFEGFGAGTAGSTTPILSAGGLLLESNEAIQINWTLLALDSGLVVVAIQVEEDT